MNTAEADPPPTPRKGNWLGIFPLAFKKNYLFTFFGPGNAFTWFKNQKVQKGTQCKSLSFP